MLDFEGNIYSLLKSWGLKVAKVYFIHKIQLSEFTEEILKAGSKSHIILQRNNSVYFVRWPNIIVFEECGEPERVKEWAEAHTSFLNFLLDLMTGRYSLDSMTDFIRLLSDIRDYYQVYGLIVEKICHLTSSTIGALTVYDKNLNMLFGKGSGYVNRELHGDVDVEHTFVFHLTPETAASKALEMRDLIVINNTSLEERILKKFVEYYKVDRVIVAPLFVESELFGVIYLGRFLGYPEYQQEEIKILRMLLPYLTSVVRLLKYQEDSIRKLKALLFVKTISEDILSETNIYKILDIARDYILELLKFEEFAFISIEGDEYKVIYSHNFHSSQLEALIDGAGCISKVLNKANNEDEEITFECLEQEVMEKMGYKSLLAAPIKIDSQFSFVLILGSKIRGTLEKGDSDFLRVVINSIGVALKNLSLYQKSLETLDKVIEMLSQLESKKDYFTANHSKEVAEFALKISKELMLPEEEMKNIYVAGLLHDLGKVVVEKAVLLKKSALNEDEWKEIKSHPHWGREILENIPGLSAVANYVETHHEKFDGSGYPFGLKAEEIPLGGRILCIADAVVTMLSDRPYRKALTREEVIFELIKEKGRQFDPQLVDIVIKILERESEAFLN
ncbi:MAG: HD domain-containing phosphohydrolase [Candidatus Hydrothermia bacterium]